MDIVPVKIVAGDPSDSANTVVVSSAPGALVDRSGTITAGGTAQVLCPANTTRRGILMENVSTSPLYVNLTGTASTGAGSFKLDPGDYWESSNGSAGVAAISIFGATTSQAFTAKEW